MWSSARRWESTGRARVVVVAPHPDDEVAGVGGTLLRHRQAGDQVTVVHVTDGRGSRAWGLGPEEMAARRRIEAESSMAVLGVSHWKWLGLPEWEWKPEAAVAALGSVLADLAPDVVYAPSRVDFHPEHDRVARALATVFAAAPQLSPTVRIYQVQVPLTGVLVNLLSPIGDQLAAARTAGMAYATQEGALRQCFRLKRYAGWFHAVSGGAEEFWEMAAGAYVALHADHPTLPLHVTFRGLRRLPLTDALAFATGRAERRRLRLRTDAWRADV